MSLFTLSGSVSCLNISITMSVRCSLSLSITTMGCGVSGTGSFTTGVASAARGIGAKSSCIFATVRSTSTSPTTMMA